MFGSQSWKFLTHLTGGIPSGSHYDAFPWVPSDQPTAKAFSVSHHRHPKENPIHSRPLAPNSSRISPSRPSSSSSRGPNDGEKKLGNSSRLRDTDRQSLAMPIEWERKNPR
jgi:hypothetical protein